LSVSLRLALLPAGAEILHSTFAMLIRLNLSGARTILRDALQTEGHTLF
jgi:hypothetical protein